MTNNQLKKLSRKDLLEMLLELRRENDQLRKKLTEMQMLLDNRAIFLEEAGSIAEASLRLNGIFEAAQAACDQYTENIRRRMEAQEQLTQKKCAEMLENAKHSTSQSEWLTDLADTPEEQDGSL